MGPVAQADSVPITITVEPPPTYADLGLPESAERMVLSEGGPGTAFGEMASLTGELRSATVIALTKVEVLVLSDRLFDGLRARRPQIAVSLVNTLAARLAEAERTLAALFDTDVSASCSDPNRAAAPAR